MLLLLAADCSAQVAINAPACLEWLSICRLAAGECSATVAALVTLVTPLPFAADFRPYFTIHYPAFARVAAGQLPLGSNRLPRLLGITNLYILKARRTSRR